MSSSLTIGVLDGVHLGHRRLLSHLSNDFTKTVLTFEPHPIEILSPGTPPRLITTFEERSRLLHSLGVDEVHALDLQVIKELSPEAFAEEHLVGRYDAKHVVVGTDFRFGRDRSGGVQDLVRIGAQAGFDVEPIDLVVEDGSQVSSSRIRELVESGEMEAASSMLSSYFMVSGEVVHGDKRGSDLGFPTANLNPPSRKVIPATGVYACWVEFGGASLMGAVNVGYRPTFGGRDLVIEAFILDFDRQIYGEELAIHFVRRLRAELEFTSAEELIGYMRRDVGQARDILSATLPPDMV